MKKEHPKNIVFEGKPYISTQRLADIIQADNDWLVGSAVCARGSWFGGNIKIHALGVYRPGEEGRSLAHRRVTGDLGYDTYYSFDDARKLLSSLGRLKNGAGIHRLYNYTAGTTNKMRKRLAKEEERTLKANLLPSTRVWSLG